jgi:hypothetical protein
LTIPPEADQDGEAYEEEAAIPNIPPDVLQQMDGAGIFVDDNDPEEPILDWDRDNPDMSVGTMYPNMAEFRLAMK